jgi:hypothetical protein
VENTSASGRRLRCRLWGFRALFLIAFSLASASREEDPTQCNFS